jgi:hypothetical protein
MATTVTLSSVGVSNAINLDWRTSGPVTAVVTIDSTSMTTDFSIQFTIDDAQLGQTQTWVGITSSLGSSVTHFSSANSANPLSISFLNPIAGLRLSSTAISSSSLTLKAIQAQGW